ncbi:bile acid:sodium symporter family protein [Corynebacterium imitans]|uniref:bile acid:sodium symporter family protein n=1 Tax=Corynebacterium imitans TaxID=156978 RepID=UPI0025517B23|nr:bile acid:sodium symporter family protein [Corynebacterium imitans]MDK8307286.1 bile acid:sodium symporter family protein [Corynebacterium imitans]MDK8636231.1 bile acid:sodium symporter family protein [Corynebacterium imitans]MDK8771429.1 bile acid:sodium symporter family protein [Corynebacterium imitans]
MTPQERTASGRLQEKSRTRSVTNTEPGKQQSTSTSIAVIGFPLMIVVFGAIGVIWPNSVSPVAPHIPELLGVVMFLMGLSLKVEDLRVLKSAPYSVLIAVVAQYLIMPLLGYAIAICLNLEPLLVAGLVVLGSVPGGASSNIVAYLAGGNVALSVAATSVSTILAPLLSPLLVLWLVGSRVEVDAGAMVTQILKMVLVPVFLGVVVQLVLRQVVEKLAPVVPWLSAAALAVVIAGIMSGSSDTILQSGLIVVIAVMIHNALGFCLGFLAAKLAGLQERERRSIAIEVGMQNAGLAATLSSLSFGPLAALPAAVATIWHNIAGAIFASFLLKFRDQDGAKV